MSTALNLTGNLAPPPERRLYPRHSVSALAYLDIGTDNGGIVLNLSEDGMGFQAVAPLDRQAEVSLRIQLPHSQERIETAARVVWLDASNRQAGVRFFDMAAEGRGQIRRWLASQNPPNALPTAGANLEPIPSSPVPMGEPAAGPSNDKWLSLMADFARPAPSASAEPDSGITGKNGSGQKIAPPISESSAKKTLAGMLNPFRQRESYNAQVNRTTQPAGAADTGYGETDRLVLPEAGVRNGTGAGGTDVPHGKSDGHSVLDFPVRDSRTAPSILSEVLAEDPNPMPGPSLLATQAHSAPALETVVASTRRLLTSQAAVDARKIRARKIGVVAVFFIVFSFLCYSVGTRVGALRSQEHRVETAPATISAGARAGSAVAANSGIDSNQESAAKTPGAPPAKTQVATSKRNLQTANRKAESPLKVSLPAPVSRSEFQPTAAKPTVSPSKPAENVASLSPLMASLSPVTNEVPTDAEPKMVAGRTLRPTDRFNPCHLTYRVEPAYPVEAEQQHIEGAVKIHQVIGTDGTVEDVRFVSGPAPLASAAMEAAKYWRYLPALLNGQPVETEQDVEIDFHLPH